MLSKLKAYLKGAASLFDWFAPVSTPYTGKEPVQADYEAISADFNTVGEDMRRGGGRWWRVGWKFRWWSLPVCFL